MTVAPELRVCVEPSVDALMEFERRAESFLAGHAVEPKCAHAAKLILEELLTNLVRHGSGVSRIEVCLAVRERELALTIEDDGESFDPQEAPQPNLGASLGDRRPGGLGLHLVRAFADRLEYRTEGNTNRLSVGIRRE